MAPAISLLAALALFSAPRSMPPLREPLRDDAGAAGRTQKHNSDYGARKNHPTSYDDNPLFKGPLKLEQTESPDFHRNRIRNYYHGGEKLCTSLNHADNAYDKQFMLPTLLGPSTPTGTILKSIVDHLARSDAPVDAKEVAESIEFYLRCGKRLIGAARRVLQNTNGNAAEKITSTVTIQDLCSGHGLTGLLFLACNPPGRLSKKIFVRTVLVDQFEPKSHAILIDCISEICPWISEDTVSFESALLEDYATRIVNGDTTTTAAGSTADIQQPDATIVISTHACGALTDKVLQYAMDIDAASLAVMPCCYTGTDAGVPYGVRRMMGVSVSADVRRSFNLQEHDYHVDFAAIPRAITPMNRIIVAERRK